MEKLFFMTLYGQKMAEQFIDKKIEQRAKMGEDVIVEVNLLSRCDLFLHTCSSVSTAVLFLSPELEHRVYKRD